MIFRLLILLLFLPLLTYSQNEKELLKISSDSILNYQDKILLAVDDYYLYLNEKEVHNIKKRWIRKIEVVKDEKYKYVYDYKGVIVIYPKKRHIKRIIKLTC